MFDLENFPDSRSAKAMLSYVTHGWYDKSYIGKWLYEVMGIELDAAAGYIETLPEQLFPETATWGLRFHEDKYGLPVREDLPVEERRMRIFRKRDLRSPMTPSRMEEYLTNAVGIEAHVADCNDPGELGYVPEHPNVFKVVFVTEETLDPQKIRDLLAGLKQSHTSCVISDWVKVTVDHRELWRFLLKNIDLRMRIPFFSAIIPGGSKNYNPKTGLAVKEIGITVEEGIDFPALSIGTGCPVREEMRCVRPSHGFGIDTLKLVEPDTKLPKLKTALYFDGREERIDVTVSTVRRNSWRFDGEVIMDGSRLFNSLFEEEVL